MHSATGLPRGAANEPVPGVMMAGCAVTLRIAMRATSNPASDRFASLVAEA
ncbi:hypothetical protein ABT352_01605 [Streptosporangium sp. NPDC000563]|uniref:hypothetical protein n=1 Tax=Streptosporangium sp. NPDC000563 TaxID=3154366 RepID=UPI0033345A74